MRKLILAAALAVVAVIVAPIASANAAEKFEGTCKVKGQATFGAGVGFDWPGAITVTTYTFAKISAECEGTATNGAKVKFGTFAGPEKWTVAKAEVTGPGKGELECGTHSKDSAEDEKFEKAIATIEVEKGGEKFPAKSWFYFKSTGNPGEIEVKLDSKKEGGGNKAKGFANFVEPGNEKEKLEVLEKCVKHTAEKLPFVTNSIAPPKTEGITGTVGE